MHADTSLYLLQLSPQLVTIIVIERWICWRSLAKISGRMDTDSYTIVMAMCDSSEAALALRGHESQGLIMEDRYYYV